MNAPHLSTLKDNCPITGGGTICLADLVGRPTILFFYPRDNTPGCTQVALEFMDHYETLQKLGTHIYGISRDTLESHEKFKTKYEFPFDLISDTEERLCDAYEVVKVKTTFGRKIRGIERSTFLYDATGKVAMAWRKVKVGGHVEEVVEALERLVR